MAQQLIFTSTPQGLEPGRSGYCTVARHKDIRHRLVRELERFSVYDFDIWVVIKLKFLLTVRLH